MKGSCLCESVEFELKNFSGNIYQCHCSICRKQGGSSSNSGAIVAIDKLFWVKGQDQVHTWKKETGFTSSFCKNCGSLVPNILRGIDYYWIPVGALEDGEFEIVANIYTDSKVSWAPMPERGVKFPTMPEFHKFIGILGCGNDD